MDAQLKAKWIEALRSGEYEQNRNGIGYVSEKRLCCIGVGAVVCEPGPKEFFDTEVALRILARHGFAGLDGEGSFSQITKDLIALNDTKRKSFAEIADYIEANL